MPIARSISPERKNQTNGNSTEVFLPVSNPKVAAISYSKAFRRIINLVNINPKRALAKIVGILLGLLIFILENGVIMFLVNPKYVHESIAVITLIFLSVGFPFWFMAMIVSAMMPYHILIAAIDDKPFFWEKGWKLNKRKDGND